MGIRCSVLGHDYGDAGVERERDERGEEVVRTARQVRTCRRCGHERTVTENTEVTALEPEAGVVRDGDGRVVAATAEENVATDGTGTITIEGGALDDASERDAEESGDPMNVDSLDDAASATETATGTAETEHDQVDDEPRGRPDAARDEGEVATVDEDADGARGRAPGEWPADPDHETTNATRSGGTSTGSLTPIDGGSHATSAASEPKPLSDGWAATTDEPMADVEGTNGAAGEGRSGETFACSACGFTAAVADSPLRAGDICPECRAGYLGRETRKG
ncbi:DUF7093 family protein [Halococcus agarilyticus]|uniref:DUF7093 family protein n=1 Tax=Halococcus agarilyticus TaxID=1232219 RepID=UPI000677C963|nr:hypothetical protein [Halococcus agarilyticus]